jgi:hypothetical protein
MKLKDLVKKWPEKKEAFGQNDKKDGLCLGFNRALDLCAYLPVDFERAIDPRKLSSLLYSLGPNYHFYGSDFAKAIILHLSECGREES